MHTVEELTIGINTTFRSLLLRPKLRKELCSQLCPAVCHRLHGSHVLL